MRTTRHTRSNSAADDRLTRRSFLGSLAATAAAPTALTALAARPGRAAAQEAGAEASPPIPVRSWNHMTLTVTDIGR